MVTETYKDARTGEMRTRSYVRGRPLGKGGFAVVFSMQDPSTGESFAAKVVAKSTLETDRARQKILTEIRIHRSVENAHVVKFKKCFEDTNNVYILMELCSDKTLADVVKRRGRLTESECAPYAREIVAAEVGACAPPTRLEHIKNPFLTPSQCRACVEKNDLKALNQRDLEVVESRRAQMLGALRGLKMKHGRSVEATVAEIVCERLEKKTKRARD